MQASLKIHKIGSGVLEESSQVWAKAYCLDETFFENDMFVGYREVDYAIVDQDGVYDRKLAQDLCNLLRSTKGATPINVYLKQVVIQKRPVLAIVGLSDVKKIA